MAAKRRLRFSSVAGPSPKRGRAARGDDARVDGVASCARARSERLELELKSRRALELDALQGISDDQNNTSANSTTALRIR